MVSRLGILAPSGEDAETIVSILQGTEVDTLIVADAAAAVAALDDARIGALVVAEEALAAAALATLVDWIDAQPLWSDLPVILLPLGRDLEASRPWIAERLGNVTMLERPLQPLPLMFSARAALGARARQRAASRHLDELAAERAALAESERRLRESEARYRTLFSSIDQGFCVIEFIDGPEGALSDYVLVEANAAYERHAGIPFVAGRRASEIEGADSQSWIPIYRHVLETGEPVRFERAFDNVDRYLELAAFRIEPAARRQVAVLFQDITERKRAESALRELNENLERRVTEALAERKVLADVVERTDTFVQVVDKDLNWLAVNRASADSFERAYGVRPRTGDNLRKALTGLPEQERIERGWLRALKGEEFTEIREVEVRGQGARCYEIKSKVLRDAQGDTIAAYQFVEDVTQRLHDQARLAEATARVHEMAKIETLGQLTGGVAHDFNNLLTPIVGALDMLHRRHGGDPRSARLLSAALQSTERATVLVQRLLSFARRQHLEARPTDVGGLVEGMRDLVQRSLGTHIPVELAIESYLPAARVDPNQLELAILNLAVNARDAMSGGGTLSVSVKSRSLATFGDDGLAPGDYVCLVVTDQGVGMDDATLRRAIEPFFTTKGQGKGTGLGLSMVHGLAAQSGGGLRLLSAPGEGTTAELWLPVAGDAAAAIGARNDEAPVQPRRARILLVDDEDLVRDATAAMLFDIGHEVIAFGSPIAALARLHDDEPVDLLITDFLMPQMRGSELIVAARALLPRLPVLLITGYAELSAGEAQALPRLAKPFRQADLARQVAILLGSEKVVPFVPRANSER
jgi:signal transduction histidine kinase